MQTTPAHGGGLLLFPTLKSHKFQILPSGFLVLPQQLRNSAVSKRPLLHPLYLCRSERWDSNAETFRTRNFNINEKEVEDVEEGFSEFLDEFIDSIWILKIFKSYGWTFPPIILSLLLANGLKAFLLALALPVGQSVFTFAIQKMWGMAQNSRGREKKKRPRRRTPINSNVGRRGQEPSTRRGKMGYRSWTSKADGSTSRIEQDAPTFGGWDELDQGWDFRMDSSMSSPEPPVEKGKLSRSERENSTPLLLRLLVAIFPFLSSWSKML